MSLIAMNNQPRNDEILRAGTMRGMGYYVKNPDGTYTEMAGPANPNDPTQLAKLPTGVTGSSAASDIAAGITAAGNAFPSIMNAIRAPKTIQKPFPVPQASSKEMSWTTWAMIGAGILAVGGGLYLLTKPKRKPAYAMNPRRRR
jgi:hypothetical protein